MARSARFPSARAPLSPRRHAVRQLLLAFLAIGPVVGAQAIEIDLPQQNWSTVRQVNLYGPPYNVADTFDFDVSAADEIYLVDFTSDRVLVLDNTFQIIRQWTVPCDIEGGSGSYVAVGTTRVYLTTQNCPPRIRAYAFDGTQGAAFGSAGSGLGEVGGLGGLAVDDAENVYALDVTNKKVVVFDSSNQFVREFPVCPSATPVRDVAVSSARQEVYVNCSRRLAIYTLTGAAKPAGNEAMPNNGMFVANAESLITGEFNLSNQHVRTLSLDASLALSSGPRMPSAFAVASKDPDVVYGLFIRSSGTDTRNFLYRAVRTYRSALATTSARIPLPTIIAASPRTGSTVFDVDYRVTDSDSPTVTTAPIAFVLNQPGLAGIRLPRTFVEGTALNIGSGIATGTVKRISWDASQDYPAQTGFLDIRFAVMASDGRPLVDFLFLDLDRATLREPAGVPDCGSGTLRISREPIRDDDIRLAYEWLLATADPAIALDFSVLPRVNAIQGPFAGNVLLEDSTPTPAGVAFLLDRMSYRVATAEELACAREGTTPGVQQYAPTALPLAKSPVTIVNEVGFDVLSSGTWVVDP